MDNERPTHARVIAAMLAKIANEFCYKALPVRRSTLNEPGTFGGNVCAWAVEEVGFMPYKIWHLWRLFYAKAQMCPDFITRLYLGLIQLVFLLPFFVLQAVLWQMWRVLKNLWGVLRGSLSYMDKKTLFPEKE